MKFIEVTEGKFVAIKKIEAIERVSDVTSVVNTSDNIYEANLPVEAIIQIIEGGSDDKQDKVLSTLSEMRNIMGTQGHFAG